jgi:D-alanine-D-alanine ligase
LGREIYVTWHDDPKLWKPINHSCHSNCYFKDGDLNSYASRDIVKGEPITIDYASFCDESLKSFQCLCGSSNCRKIITGSDYLVVSKEGRLKDFFSPELTNRRKNL